MSVGEMCTDNRFELIEKYKNRLIEATNIETDEDEMKVIDNILFRFWQMKWLDALEKQIPKKATPHKVETGKIKIGNANWCKGTTVYKCPCCDTFISKIYDYCHKCGQALDWSDTE